MNLQRLIEQYISLQQSLGASFTVDAAILRAFGRARGTRASVAGVHLRHVDAFLGKARPVTRTWFRNLFGLRSFFHYAASRGYITTAPLPTIMPKEPPSFVPYIYSQDEIRRLLQATESRTGNTRLEPGTIRTMILVFYGAGLRRREAVNLTRADVNLRTSVLTIRNTKFSKTRLVPVGPQLGRALAQYDGTRPGGRPAEAPFFTTRTGSIVNADTLHENFRILCDHTGIRRTDETRSTSPDSRLATYVCRPPSHNVVPARRGRAAARASPFGVSGPCLPGVHAGIPEHDAGASSRSQPAFRAICRKGERP